RDRGPRILRHGFRAVAAEDFEDMAREASPAVALARALGPVFDPLLLADPNITPGFPSAGQVLLMLIPFGAEPQPVPGLGLIRDVEAFITARCAPAVELRIAGPDWVQVNVTVTLVPSTPSGADALRAAVIDTIVKFLHPLTGGPGSEGWEFGQLPHESD